MPRPAASVLIVDDDADHRFLIERALTAVGHSVQAVERGIDALTMAGDVDIVLLDYRLPDMSGLEVLRALIEIDGEGPSVVMVTAMGSEHVAVEAMRSGAVDYVVKDANYLQALPGVIERAFRVHDLSRRARLMQRITLLVNSSLDRVAVAREILRGARQVLRADACALYMLDVEGELEEVLDGVAASAAERVRHDARAVLLGVEPKTDADGDCLFVPLPENDGRRQGVLAVITEGHRHFEPEELRLAETFAAFAGIALANAGRMELERSLVSELQQTLDLRRGMVMSLSHELRTPLTCIRGFAETMLGHWAGLDDKTRHDAVRTISEHADDLQRLVEQLLDFGALETGRLASSPEELRLDREVASSLAALAPMIGERAVELDIEPVSVLADARLLRRTLSNLVSNAVKYSGPGGHIAIVGRAEASAARVTVVDSGVGLSADEAAHVFEPFWRAPRAVTSATRGSGIGLALVQEYVRVMGGEVSVASMPGQGSRFSFTLPLSSVPAPTA